jgi:hypothetical protein
MGSHVIDGEFQSDKYPTCPRGKVPLSVKDPTAQDLLWEYAQRRSKVDAEFSSNLEAALRSEGYDPKAWKHAGRPLADETVVMARRYLDNANREAARMAAGVVLMHEELGKLSRRCLCSGMFRCTPCLDGMEADGIHMADVDAVCDDMLLTLELLRMLPISTTITCHQCGGRSPEPEFCGCGNKQTVGEAIRWYESQLEILSK